MEWLAIYNDGTTLPQYNEDGTENKYTDIKRDELIGFALSHNKVAKLALHLDPNKKLIYRKRVAKKFSGAEEAVYLCGWQELVEGKNRQCLCAVFEDGHIEVLDGFKEGTQWFYPVIFRPEERV